jgi:regulator of sigma E protease
MNITNFLYSAVPFVLILGLLVFVHEWGHYVAARRAGMKVHAFAIGMGPAIWTFRRRFPAPPQPVSLTAPGETSAEGASPSDESGAATEQEEFYETTYSICAIPIGGYVRIAGMDPNEDPDEPGGFNTRPWGWRFVTLIAGCVMNFVLAAFIFCLMGMFIGYPVGSTNKIDEVIPKTPAASAGLKPGDRIVGVADLRTSDVSRLRTAIESHPGEKIQLLIQRGGESLTRPITPSTEKEDGKTVGRIGIAFGQSYERVNPIKAVGLGVTQTYDMTAGMIEGIVLMIRGKVQGGVGGPAAIFEATGREAKKGTANLMGFAAMLSINLGIINLLPIPALDGGRLLFLLLEALRRGRRVDPKKEAYVHFVGLVLILLFMVVITYHDIKNIIHGG